MVRTLLRPGWIVSHLLVAATAVLFVSLGLWQLDRHAEREAELARIAERQDLPAVALEELLADPDPHLRLATATGTYDPDGDVRLSPRTRNDLPGYEVLTPFRLRDGRTLLVDRGWVPLDVEPPPPPVGEVTATVRLREPGVARQVLPPDADAAAGRPVELVSAVDLDRLAPQLEDPVTTAWAEVVDEDARAAGAIPRPADPPAAPGSGNHLSYAGQWFLFAAVGVVGYPLLLRRRLADRAAADAPRQPVASGRP